MDKKVLNTGTSILLSGNNVGIFTYYKGFEKNISMFISDSVNTINGVIVLEGNLIYQNNGWGNIDFKINNKGELIAIGSESSKFDINNEGYLTVTE